MYKIGFSLGWNDLGRNIRNKRYKKDGRTDKETVVRLVFKGSL